MTNGTSYINYDYLSDLSSVSDEQLMDFVSDIYSGSLPSVSEQYGSLPFYSNYVGNFSASDLSLMLSNATVSEFPEDSVLRVDASSCSSTRERFFCDEHSLGYLDWRVSERYLSNDFSFSYRYDYCSYYSYLSPEDLEIGYCRSYDVDSLELDISTSDIKDELEARGLGTLPISEENTPWVFGITKSENSLLSMVEKSSSIVADTGFAILILMSLILFVYYFRSIFGKIIQFFK